MAGQLWLTPNLGGYMWSPNLSKVLRQAVQPLVKFRQFADVKDAAIQEKKKGQSFHWNVYSDVAAQGTTLGEGTAMPQTNFTITQGTMSITEYGNSVPFTSLLDDLSEHPVKEVINKVLKNDAKKAFDIAAEAQFNATPLRMIATAGTATDAITLYTNGTVTGTNNVALGKDHIKAIVDTMKERNIPPYVNDDYMALAHPTTFRKLKNDLETLHSYVDQGFRMILNGEIGRYEGVRFVEQTNIAKGANWAVNAKSNWAYFFGDDTVAEGVVTPEEMRGAIPSDYGRSMGIAWYYLGGFGLVHTAAAQARILKWDSQA
ncbi:MAG TPA: N4-gp56 family major capsid protein [Burkholderiaceae bacterium]|nr:N4-gp56 family major capsid protein [Burkholderiaceae bacterium]